ncbi:hypothetical protein D3C80_1333440 [compost metagenome]
MISARRGAEDMIVTRSDRSAGLLPSSEKSWMPAGRPERKLSKRSSASSARLLSPKARSRSGVSSVNRSRASTDCVAR